MWAGCWVSHISHTSALAKHLIESGATPLAESRSDWQARMELPLPGGGGTRLGGLGGLARISSNLLLPLLLLAANLSRVAIAAVPANASLR